MDKLTPVITQIGKQKAFNASINGVKIAINRIGVGSGAYTPNENRTALVNERERLPIVSSVIDPANSTIVVHTIIESNLEYWISEVGFYLDDGTLFAVWSHPTYKLGYKSRINRFLLGYTIKIVDIPFDVVQIIDQGQPLNIYYATEFVNFTNSIVNMGRGMVEINDKLTNAKNEISSLDSWCRVKFSHLDNIINSMNKIELLNIANTITLISDAILALKLKN